MDRRTRPDGSARSAERRLADRRRAPGAPSGAPIRLALFAALLLGLTYATLAMVRIQSTNAAKPAEAALIQAQAAAARIDTAVATLRSSLIAASASRRRFGGDPLDAAETALAATGGLAQGVAVADDSTVIGATGAARAAAWPSAVKAALASGQDFWLGTAPGGGPWLYTAAVANNAGPDGLHRTLVLAVVDPQALRRRPRRGRDRAGRPQRPPARAFRFQSGRRRPLARPCCRLWQGRRLARQGVQGQGRRRPRHAGLRRGPSPAAPCAPWRWSAPPGLARASRWRTSSASSLPW
ncbi:MAG: hypothetical protein WDN45_08350 [Caulobacteraceae bacterium]